MVAYLREEFEMAVAFSRHERRTLRSKDVRESGCHRSPREESPLADVRAQAVGNRVCVLQSHQSSGPEACAASSAFAGSMAIILIFGTSSE